MIVNQIQDMAICLGRGTTWVQPSMYNNLIVIIRAMIKKLLHYFYIIFALRNLVNNYIYVNFRMLIRKNLQME